VKNVVCFGADSESVADQNRFTYSFSTDSQDKLTSGESTYATRRLTVTLENGTTIDSWQYNALSGSFFEYGGIFTQPLPEESVYKLNQIFGIE
jgi:glycyl-tRNA synthetase alpha subunit